MPAALTRLPKINRWMKGLVTQRNPIDTPFSVVGMNVVAHNDALIDGANIENSSNNTLIRRWGLSQWSSAAFSGDPTQHVDGIWSFRNLQGVLRTVVSGSVGLRWMTPSSSTQIIPPGLNPFADFWSIAITGDYMYATSGSAMPIRWQPDHPQGIGATQFQMGMATPTAKPTINVVSLAANKWTSLFIPTTDAVSGTFFVNQSDTSVQFSMSIVGTSIAIQWVYTNYPVGPGPITTATGTTPSGTTAQVGIDPENGQATVNIDLTAAGMTLTDFVTILVGNTSLTVDTYGVPQVTFDRVFGNMIPNGGLFNTGDAAALQVTLSPLSDAPQSGLADNASTNYSLQMFPGSTPTISYFTLPQVQINDSITGAVTFSTRLNNGGFTNTTVTVSGVNAQGLVNAIRAALPAFFAVNLQRTADIVQVAVLPVQPGTETPGANQTWTISQNSLFNNTANANLSWQQFNVNTGGVKPLNFNQFGYVLKNEVIGHVSTMSDFVTFNKPSFGSTIQIVVASNNRDPQVTGTELYATSDGGSSFLLTPQFFTVGSIGLTQIRTFYYFTPDNQLNPQIVAPLDGINNPPPTNLQGLVKHTQRMWGFVGNKLYYSGGPDTTNGLGDEAWSASDFYQFPGGIVKVLSTAQGLLVFLNDDLHIVEGTDKASYYPHILAANFGISNPHAACYDGQTTFCYTTSKQLHAFSPQQQDEIGYDIADILQQQFDPLTTELAYHRGPSTDNALFVSNGLNRMIRFTPKGWSVLGIYNSIGTIASIQTAPGVIQLMMAQSKQTHTSPINIWFRDYASFQDLGTPFAAFAVVGGISLVDPGSPLPSVDNLIIQGTAVGSPPTISLLLNELTGAYQLTAAKQGPVFDPPTARMPSSTLRQLRYYAKDSLNPIVERANTLFVRFDWPAENAQNELFGLYVRETP